MHKKLQNLFDLRGKQALVTGGNSGLGLAMAHCLGIAGARIILLARREAELKSAALQLEQDSIDILTELGCEYRGQIKMTMSPMTGVDLSGVKNSMKIGDMVYKYEPIFIFYKP